MLWSLGRVSSNQGLGGGGGGGVACVTSRMVEFLLFVSWLTQSDQSDFSIGGVYF